MAYLRWCIFTFVCFFSAVCYQMSPQIICLRTCVITLATFFWLFSAVCFQMSPHIVCPSGRKATLVTLVFPLTCFCHSHGSFCFIIVFIWVKMLKILIHHNLQERRRRDKCWTSVPLMFWLFQILTKQRSWTEGKKLTRLKEIMAHWQKVSAGNTLESES